MIGGPPTDGRLGIFSNESYGITKSEQKCVKSMIKERSPWNLSVRQYL